jgi:hypothetical protein
MPYKIIASIEVEGFHFYNSAPQEVCFLKNNHRHDFRVNAKFDCLHADRDLEIFIVRDKIKNFLHNVYGNPCEFGEMSCEMIARVIVEQFANMGCFYCEVWEEKTGAGIYER